MKETRITRCPVGKIVVDFSTKPAYGSDFACHRSIVQGKPKEEFSANEKQHREALEKNDPWDDLEFDLEGL